MKRIISVLLAFFIAVSAAGCSHQSTAKPSSQSSTTSQDFDKITLGLTYIPDVQFGPIYVALEKGYFREAGVDVTLRHHGAQEALFGALESGAEDIVFAGATEMMQARSQGIDVVNWATLYQNYPVTLIVPKSAGVKTPADLEGKKIGLPGPYGENYYALLAMQDSYNLGQKVTPSYIGYTQVAALVSQQVDAIIGFENNDLIAIRNAGLDVEQIPLVKGEIPLVGAGLGSLKTNLNPKVYARILSAIEKGVKDSQEDPQAAMDLIAKHVPSLADPDQRALATEVFQATLKLYSGNAQFGHQDPQLWEEMSIFLAKAGIVDKAVPPLNVFSAEVVKLSQAAKQP
ncbi:ABC transporter substrate-binding protein [Arcanobacterium pinnipediorum]|uniref:Thiamine pyrimidine synthase n=1 Tax=Arcanobacterium pinnipediorum TaxID=1503041 RepID=A0ABY5AH91_9ACTO|nr:ABC transporter substrate-binding protein [Arcanobacterium pinnipediorum]USR78629.1 ABC transporter substrate-binding protein [Arcanobacterium pinnipediorum]